MLAEVHVPPGSEGELPIPHRDSYISLTADNATQHQYDNQELKMLSKLDIQAKLSTQNVLNELFGTFTYRSVSVLSCDA